jgi:hypothetical protein
MWEKINNQFLFSVMYARCNPALYIYCRSIQEEEAAICAE